MWGKVMLFETCDRVPLVIRVPQSVTKVATEPGSQTEGLVELIDLFPTLAELCGVEPPPELQGQSLSPLIYDPATSGKDFAYTVVTRGPTPGKAIRTQRYHYTKWPSGEELYDLSADPGEERNLAGSVGQSATLKRMRAVLDRTEIRAKEASK